MTKARSIFMRKGNLLAAVAVALLLLASTGTASAQPPRIGFTPVSGSVNEGATANADSEHPLLRGDRKGVGPARGPRRREDAERSTDRASAGYRRSRRDHYRDRRASVAASPPLFLPEYDTDAALDEDAVFAESDTFQADHHA